MTELHPAATHHLPAFITAPGGTDVLLSVATGTVIGSVFGVGLLFLWLHSLPERLAHKAHKLQMELVAALCLLSLFTHVHTFWVAGLVLALVKFPEFEVPDIAGPLERIAQAIRSPRREMDKTAVASAADPLKAVVSSPLALAAAPAMAEKEA